MTATGYGASLNPSEHICLRGFWGAPRGKAATSTARSKCMGTADCRSCHFGCPGQGGGGHKDEMNSLKVDGNIPPGPPQTEGEQTGEAGGEELERKLPKEARRAQPQRAARTEQARRGEGACGSREQAGALLQPQVSAQTLC